MSDSAKETSAQSLLWLNIFSDKKDNHHDTVVEVLKKVPLFNSLNLSQIKFLANIMHVRSYETNESIFEMDQPGAALFIVQEGEVGIYIPVKDKKDKELAVLKAGSFFGELALLDQSPRSATARATTQSKVIALFRKDLDELVHHEPAIASRIYQALAVLIGERLKATNKLV